MWTRSEMSPSEGQLRFSRMVDVAARQEEKRKTTEEDVVKRTCRGFV